MRIASLFAVAALAATSSIAFAHPGGGKGLERLRAADTNQDGLISRAEAAALPRLAERFDAVDANHDGQVSLEELRAARRQGVAAHLFRKADANNDGRVSRDEFIAQAMARFERLDQNADGAITPEEIRAARLGHRGR